MSERIAIIAALEREVAPFVARGFSLAPTPGTSLDIPGLKAYSSGDSLLLIAGIGRAAATRAARAAVEFHHPTLLVSAGFAGSLTPELVAADLITPNRIVDGASGRVFAADSQMGEATLVTAASVLSRDTKSALAARFSAQAVDMEAAAVAQVAENAGVRFLAIKAVSDPFDFEMPPLSRFIDSAGKLNLLKLLVYSAPRPRLWGTLGQLGRNTARAAEALAGALAGLQARDSALAK